MELYDKILNTPQRENNGAIAGNRFQYQYHWALIKLLRLFNEQDDFVLFLEFAEDIIILDSEDNPKEIDFYQIKTNNDSKSFYWTLGDLMKTGTTPKPKKSFMQKLIDNYVRYEGNVKQINFISNKPYKFKSTSSLINKHIFLKDLSTDEFKKVQDNICNFCKNKNCSNECKSLVVFSISELPFDSFRNTCIGELSEFLDKNCKSKDINERALYKTLISDIERKSNVEDIPTDKEKLIDLKSITRKQFSEQLNKIDINSQIHNEWGEIHTDISKYFNMIETKKIKKAFERLIIDMLNPENLLLNKIIQYVSDIREYIEDNFEDDLKSYLYKIVNKIRIENDISNSIFDDYYLIAIILRELKK